MHERSAVDEPLAGQQGDEHRAVRHLKEHGESPHSECHHQHVREREGIERVREWERGDQECAADVGRDHDLSPAAAPVDPRARVEREEEVGRQLGREEVAHLCRVRVEREHGDERERNQRHLVADERHGVPEPEAPETQIVAQEGRHQHRSSL